MGLFSNLANSPDALALLAAGGAMATPATRVPVPFAYSALQGASALPQGIAQYNQLKSQGLTLEQQEAAQPGILASIKGISDPNNQTNSSINPLSRQALMFAMRSGDPKTMASTMTSIMENDPSVKAANTQAVQDKTMFKMADDTYKTGAELRASGITPPAQSPAFGLPNAPIQMPQPSGNPTVAPPAPVSMTNLPPMGAPQANSIPPIPFGPTPPPTPAQMTGGLSQGQFSSIPPIPPAPPAPGQNPPASPAAQNPLVARDGQPIIPEVKNLPFMPPDPKQLPRFSTPNTKQGVEQNLSNQKEMQTGSQEFSTLQKSFANEGAQVDDLLDTYSKVQAGTLTAQNPELMAKLAAWGVLPKDGVNDLAGVQRAMNTHIMDVIGQMKDTNANIGGGAATRLFGAEIRTMLEEGANPGDRPEAMFNILTKAKGLVNQGQDLVQGWQSIGGRGNRLAGGDSLLPDDYTQKFYDAHPVQGYVDAARKSVPPLKGMDGAPTGNKNWVRVNGQLVPQ